MNSKYLSSKENAFSHNKMSQDRSAIRLIHSDNVLKNMGGCSSFLSLPGAQCRFLSLSLRLKATAKLLLMTDKGCGVTTL